MRQIKIDFRQEVPRKQTGDWGNEGEHNETVLECVLSDSFSQCEYINAEFETANHKKIVLDELKPEGNILMVPLIQQVTVEGRLKMQLVGYMLNEETYELEAVSKTDLVTGNIAKGIAGICEECNPEPSFMELLWAKVRKLWDMRHSHHNQEILDQITEEQATDLAANTEARHEHENKDVLDKITEDANGNLLYNGAKIGGTDEADDEDIMDTMTEMGLINPIVLSDGSILISNNNEIYSL